MTNIYAPLMRALVVVALVLATATLVFVAVNTARADPPPASHIPNS
jgi:multisubunit Na+/H+ antiporter MnhC subunit